MRWERRSRLYAALIALSISCSGQAPEEHEEHEQHGQYETVAFGRARDVEDHDPGGERCEELGAVRVCFGEDGPHVVPSIAPPAPPDAMWRCTGHRCVLIRERPFACGGGQCRQRWARVPDDADWECADVRGLVVCRDRARPAGMIAGPPELGWICGDGTPRICIDLASDRPGAGNYDCSFVHEPVPERVCAPSDEPTLGGPCRGECPDGTVCTDGTCVPRAIGVPDCWTDADCEGGRCVFASCSSS